MQFTGTFEGFILHHTKPPTYQNQPSDWRIKIRVTEDVDQLLQDLEIAYDKSCKWWSEQKGGYKSYFDAPWIANEDGSLTIGLIGCDFISFLSSKNFIIPEKTFSHYHTSFLTITSLLNLDYINHLTVDVGENSKNRFQAYKMIDQNKIMKITKSQGYVNVNIDSGWEATRYISSADLNLCGKNQFLNSQTIVMMIKNSMLNPVYVKIFESDYRDRITCSFNSISTIHNETKQPVFVFAHIFLPHGPYYWGPDGEYNVPTKATLEGFHKDKIGFTDQLQFTNKKVKEFVTKILDESKTPPIIILFSDHGTMLTYDDHISEDFILERMSNIMYVHLPENNLESLNNNLSSINLLRMISNDHLNQKFSYLCCHQLKQN